MMNATDQQKTVFVQDNHRNRAQRTERIERLKQLGYKVIPARDWELSRQRCLTRDFDLIVVHEGDSLARAIELCEAIRADKPEQRLMLVTNGEVQHPYAVRDNLDAMAAAARENEEQEIPLAA
jgi:hypothetical protein